MLSKKAQAALDILLDMESRKSMEKEAAPIAQMLGFGGRVAGMLGATRAARGLFTGAKTMQNRALRSAMTTPQKGVANWLVRRTSPPPGALPGYRLPHNVLRNYAASVRGGSPAVGRAQRTMDRIQSAEASTVGSPALQAGVGPPLPAGMHTQKPAPWLKGSRPAPSPTAAAPKPVAGAAPAAVAPKVSRLQQWRANQATRGAQKVQARQTAEREAMLGPAREAERAGTAASARAKELKAQIQAAHGPELSAMNRKLGTLEKRHAAGTLTPEQQIERMKLLERRHEITGGMAAAEREAGEAMEKAVNARSMYHETMNVPGFTPKGKGPAKGTKTDIMDWVKKNPGLAAGAAGGTGLLAGAALGGGRRE